MQFFKKMFFGFVWSVGIFISSSVLIGIIESSTLVSHNDSQYGEDDNVGSQYSTVLLGALAIGFGGSFMGVLPGVRKEKTSLAA